MSNRGFERSMNGINDIEVNEVQFPDGSTISSASNLVQLDTNNNFTSFNTFNVNLPTSTLDPVIGDIAGNTILNKNSADKLYATTDTNDYPTAFTRNGTTGEITLTTADTGTPLSGDTTITSITDAQISQITTNANNITTNTSNITTNTNNIATNTSDIATNTANIATNTSNIATNTSNITTNTNDIATNTANITTNTSNIATNTTNITTNTNDIATLDGAVVKLSGNQTIAGVKTFSSVPECSIAPTNSNELTNKSYVDSQAGGTPSNMMTTDTTQSITGQKTFNAPFTFIGGGSYNSALIPRRLLQNENTNSYIEQSGADCYIDQTQTTNKIITQGKIGIGTASPTEKLEVVGNALIQGTSSVSTPTITMGASPYQKGFAIYTDPYIRCVGVQAGMKTHNQYCALACGTFYAANAVRFGSDDRIKHNEQEIPDALDLIDQLKPYKYKKSENIYDASYNGDISGNWEWEIGLIAQDILKIPYLSFAVGNDPDNSIYTLNYATFIGVLIQGVKDLNEKNKELSATLSQVQERIKKLEDNI